MANLVCDVLLTEIPLAIGAATGDPDAGAIVEFQGTVRRLEDGREISGIEYESHEAMAEHQMEVIARRAIDQFGLRHVLLHHRIGFVRSGEVSLWLRVASQHRGAAFDAAVWIVAELKQKVPIWKRPKFETETPLRVSRRDANVKQMV